MSETQAESQEPSPSPTDQALSDPGYLARVIADTMELLAFNSHVHKWDVLGAWNPPGQPIHPRLVTPVPQTIALIRCRECGLPETTELDGVWTLEQITASAKIGK